MKHVFPFTTRDQSKALMSLAGYSFHCVDAGRLCYHRRLNEPAFPRFHIYIALTRQGMILDLHFDALDEILHKGNHDKEWAYEGGRITGEMQRIITIFNDQINTGKYNSNLKAQGQNSESDQKEKKSLFDILFKTM